MKLARRHKIGYTSNNKTVIEILDRTSYKVVCIRCSNISTVYQSHFHYNCIKCTLGYKTKKVKDDIATALEMFVGQGKQIKEISKHLKISESGVSGLISRHFFGKNQKKLKLQSKINYELHQSNT